MTILIVIILLAFCFDFINGFHDTANAIATCVSTRALKLPIAIAMAAVMNFLGAILFTGVAETIAKNIVNLDLVKNGSVVLATAIGTAIIWNLATWLLGIPSSSSHALIGAMIGASIADGGAYAIHVSGVLRIISGLIATPFIAIGAGYLMFSLFKKLFFHVNAVKGNRVFRKVQIFSAAFQAFSHGSNDAQKSMGIITMALVSHGVLQTMAVPHWVQIGCAAAMCLGTSIGGWRIIKTVGTGIMKIRPVNGVAADLAASIVIQVATHFDLPVSTTHVISSSIIGVGASQRIKAVKWLTARKMVMAWFITIPITVGVSFGLFHLIALFIH
jgi:PiT family inorganic phosphate transporter